MWWGLQLLTSRSLGRAGWSGHRAHSQLFLGHSLELLQEWDTGNALYGASGWGLVLARGGRDLRLHRGGERSSDELS